MNQELVNVGLDESGLDEGGDGMNQECVKVGLYE